MSLANRPTIASNLRGELINSYGYRRALFANLRVLRQASRRSSSREAAQMATDYDAQRKNDDDTESIEAIKERIPSKPSISEDDVDNVDSFTIPDVVNEELEVVILPQQENEFTCMNCFLVKPQSQKASKTKLGAICSECAY
jgi:hypothetical protein